MAGSGLLVSAQWLQSHLGDENLRIVDASWYLPTQGRDARGEYEAAHIPGAVFFDHDQIVAPGSKLPHTLPDPETFRVHAEAMGISDDDRIVVYDGPGFFSAPRAWWMFHVMGARTVGLLDGGFDRWKDQGRPVTDTVSVIAQASFRPRFDADRIVGFDEMRRIVNDRSAQIADARPAGRFEGSAHEPRPGMRSGHMPGARNLPAIELSRDGSLLPPDELRMLIERNGIDLSRPVVTSCGSGVTAAAISFALQSLGHEDHRLYDGSWSEWGGREDTPVVTGKE